MIVWTLFVSLQMGIDGFVYDEPDADELITRTIEATYSFQLDAARSGARLLIENYPDHSAGLTLLAETYWWEAQADRETKSSRMPTTKRRHWPRRKLRERWTRMSIRGSSYFPAWPRFSAVMPASRSLREKGSSAQCERVCAFIAVRNRHFCWIPSSRTFTSVLGFQLFRRFAAGRFEAVCLPDRCAAGQGDGVPAARCCV